MRKCIFWVVLVSVFMLLSLNFSYSATTPVYGINVSRFTMNTTAAGCNESINISIRILDLLNSSSSGGMSYVVFTIAGVDYRLNANTSITNGNKFNGTWTLRYNVTATGANLNTTYTVSRIRVVADYLDPDTGSNFYCDFTPTLSSSGSCTIYTGGYLGYPNTNFVSTCICAPSLVDGACNSHNTMTQGWSNVDGCVGVQFLNRTINCDYCDPGWSAYYSQCEWNSDNTDFESSVLKGVSQKSYASSDSGACCASTGATIGWTIFNHDYGSDCKKPVDEGVIRVCYKDAWLGYGSNHLGSNINYVPSSSYLSNYTPENRIAWGDYRTTYAAIGPANYTQPLFYDIDDDGYSEVIFANGDDIYAYTIEDDGDFALDVSGAFATYTFPSQPAIWGINDYSTSHGTAGLGIYECALNAVDYPPCDGSLHVVYAVNVSGTSTYIKSFNVTTSEIVEDKSWNINRTLDWRSGVTCKDIYCYVKSVDNYGIRVTITTGAVSEVSLYTGSDENYKMNAPILFDADEDGDEEVIWFGSNNAAASNNGFICRTETDLSGKVCVGSGTLGLNNISGIVAGYRNRTQINPVIFATGTSTEVVTGLMEFDLKTVNLKGGVGVIARTDNVWRGEDYGCISNPILMKCGSSTDLKLAYMHFNGKELDDVSSVEEWLGQYNSDQTGEYQNYQLFESDFNMESDLYLYDSLILADSGKVIPTPVWIDSNNDGELEFWFVYESSRIAAFSSDILQVLDSDLISLDNKAFTGNKDVYHGYMSNYPYYYRTHTFAADVDGDGISEFVFANSTHIIAANLNSSNKIEYKYTYNFNALVSVGSIDASLWSVVRSELYDDYRYILKTNQTDIGSINSTYPVFTLRFDTNNFTLNNNRSLYRFPGTPAMPSTKWVGVWNNEIYHFSWNMAYPNLWVDIRNLEASPTNITKRFNAGSYSPSHYMVHNFEPIDYYGSGEKREIFISTVPYNPSSATYSTGRFYVLGEATGSILYQNESVNCRRDPESTPYTQGYCPEGFMGAVMVDGVLSVIGDMRNVGSGYHKQSFFGDYFAPDASRLNVRNLEYSMTADYGIIPCIFIYGTRSYWVCGSVPDDTTGWLMRSNSIGSDGGVNNVYNFSIYDVDDGTYTYAMNGNPYVFDIDSDGNDELIVFGSDDTIRVYKEYGGESNYYSYATCVDPNFNMNTIRALALGLGGSPEEECQIMGITSTNFGLTGAANWDEIVSGYGSINLYYGMYSFESPYNTWGLWTLPIDIDSNGQVDLIFHSPSVTRAFLANLGREAISASNILNIDAFECSNVAGFEGRFIECTMTVSSPGTDGLYYWFDPGLGDGSMTDVLNAIDDPEMSAYIDYSESGTYTVTAYAQYGADVVSKEYDIEINITRGTVSGVCTLTPDGEFSNTGTASSNGWDVTNDDYTEVSSGYLSFLGSAYLYHGFSCDRSEIVIQTKMETDDSGFGTISVWGNDASGIQTEAAKIGYYGGYSDSAGFIDVYTGGVAYTVGLYSVSGSVLTLNLSYIESMARLYVDGALVYNWSISTDIISWKDGEVQVYGSPTNKIDYIRLTSGKTVIRPTTSKIVEDLEEIGVRYSLLSQCESGEPEYVAGSSMSYPLLWGACSARVSRGDDDAGYCNYKDLNLIYKYNPACTKEIMNYCVDVTYRREEGLGSAQTEISQGPTVCAANVFAQIGMYSFFKPIGDSIWDIATSNIVLIMGFVIVLLIVFAAIGSRRR